MRATCPRALLRRMDGCRKPEAGEHAGIVVRGRPSVLSPQALALWNRGRGGSCYFEANAFSRLRNFFFFFQTQWERQQELLKLRQASPEERE